MIATPFRSAPWYTWGHMHNIRYALGGWVIPAIAALSVITVAALWFGLLNREREPAGQAAYEEHREATEAAREAGRRGDHDKEVAILERVVAADAADGETNEVEGFNALALANSMTYAERDGEGFAVKAELWRNPDYSLELRCTAAFDSVQHVEQNLGALMSAQQAREKVFAADRFGALLPSDMPLASDADIYAAVRHVMRALADDCPDGVRPVSTYAKITLAVLSFADLTDDKAQLPEIEYRRLATDRANEAKALIDAVDQVVARRVATENGYDTHTGLLIQEIWRATNRLYNEDLNFVTIDEVRQRFDQHVLYQQTLSDDVDFLTRDLSLAINGYSMAYYEARALGVDKDPTIIVDSETADRMREQLSYLYELDPFHLARRAELRKLPQDKEGQNYKIFRYLAMEIDPALKALLIERIGGWTTDDFK